jgi:hypothetical protein
MTYPQPSSTAPVLAGQDNFRLTTPLRSGGDIYESEVSAYGFAVGPNSDLASIAVTYFDENASSFTNQAIITPDRNIVGRIDARNDSTYPGATPRRGRILLSPNDIWDNNFEPLGFDVADDVIRFVAPVLDVIQYFTPAPSVTPPRSDREFRFQYYDLPNDLVDGITWVAIPAYGRKSGFFTFKNIGNGIVTTNITVMGVKLSASASPGPIGAVQKVLFTDGLITGGTQTTYAFKSSADGVWDLLLIGLGGGAGPGPYNGGPFPTTVVLSDDIA